MPAAHPSAPGARKHTFPHLVDAATIVWFRHAVLRHAPARHARMVRPGELRNADIKYLDRDGPLTDAQLGQHLTGRQTFAAPMAVAGQAHVLPLDVDAGGLAALRALLDACHARGLWAFGQHCPRPDWGATEQRGYVWVPFDHQVDARQFQQLGQALIRAVVQSGWQIEPRAHGGDTRLPFGRHTHTGVFGDLLLGDAIIPIDADPAGALAQLRAAYRENPLAGLPVLPAEPVRATLASESTTGAPGHGIDIHAFNTGHDLVALLEQYGARRSRGSRTLYVCPFHDDRHASLRVYHANGRPLARCLSAHSDCPLAAHPNDAFNIYCVAEGLTPTAALRRLNGLGDRPERHAHAD